MSQNYDYIKRIEEIMDEDARDMLRRIYEPVEVATDETTVVMKNLNKWEIDGYLSLADYNYPGAYSPVGKGAFFVRSVMGDYNVIKGMPVKLLMDLLERKYGITPVEGKNIWWKGSNE